ncbi:FG-GAP-like repeat-containing protein, partial [Fusibacter ferrireducens]
MNFRLKKTKKILVIMLITVMIFPYSFSGISKAESVGGIEYVAGTNPISTAGATVDDGTTRYLINIDYDSDGDEDFIAYNGSQYAFYKNDGAGLFIEVEPNVTLPIKNAEDYLVADFDNDGDEDIYAVGGYFRNNGDGTFTSVPNPVSTAGATVDDGTKRYIVNIDYDSDGDEDFIAYNGSKYVFYKNDGSGSFAEITPNVTLPIKNAEDYLVADFDNDGDEDIYAVGGYFRNNGDGTFTSVPNPVSTAGATVDNGTTRYIVDIDYDSDGDEDFIAYNGSKYIFYKNDGSGSFAEVEPNVTLPLKNAITYLIADFDNDGDEDIYAPGGYFTQNGTASNTNNRPPKLTLTSPTDDATNFPIGGDIILDFDEPILSAGTGKISIYKSDDDSLIESIEGTNEKVSGVNSNSIVIKPSVTLEGETAYYIKVEPKAFFDEDGMTFAGILDKTTLNFVTKVSSSPEDLINKIYFTESSSGHYRVARTDLDGTNLEQIYYTDTGNPASVAVDSEASKIFFSDPKDGIAKIYSLDLDGSNLQVILSNVYADDIAVDAVNSKIYFTESKTVSSVDRYRVCRIDLDGTNLETLYDSPTGTPKSVAVDPVAGKIYFSDPHTSVKKIYSANLDGSNPQAIISDVYANDIAVDPINDKIYFTEGENSHYRVVRTDLEGSNLEIIYESDYGMPQGVTVNPTASKIYFSDPSINVKKIYSANLDGTSVTEIVTNMYANDVAFPFVESSNTSPTAANFTVSSGLFQDATYTFGTADFGYSDGNSDVLDHLRITAVPASGTLYVDANDNDLYDSGEAILNGATISKTDLDAGNLQYITDNRADTSFTFDVNDGTSYSDTTYTATLNISAAATVSTQAVTSITSTTATGHGNITDLGKPNPTAYGVCWNTTGSPTISADKTDEGGATATGAFTTSMTGLSANTKYYVKAYVTNAVGTRYGEEVVFSTDTTAPVLTAGTVNRTSDTAGSVKFTSDEAGNYYYEVVASGDPEPTIDTSGSGTVCSQGEITITNPVGLTAGAKSIYIKVKDSADNVSNVLKIDIPAYVAPDTTAPVLTAGAVNRTSDTAGSVKFTSDEAGNYYYEVVASGDPAPTVDTSGVGTACTTSETTIDLSGLTAGTKSIYIKVKDSADNVSNVLKIDIPAYVAPDTTAPVLTAGAVNRTSDTAGSVKFTSDESGNYYYEVVASGDPEPTIDTSGSGTVCSQGEITITNPVGLTVGAKSIYIKVKDSADNVSNVLKIDIPAYVAPDTTAPVLTAGTVNRTSDTAGSVKFTSDEAGNYYYEVVASGDPEPTIDTSGSGTVCSQGEITITNPVGLTAGAKSIYIKVKDSADNVSNVLKIDIPAYVAPDTTAPVLTAGTVNRTSDTAGSVKFTSDEAGNYYYEVVASGDPEPTIDTSGSGTVCSQGEITITNPVGLTAGAKSIYIKVKDSADNVSNVLKIDIPAYVAPDTTAPVLTAGTVSRTSDTAGSVKFTSDEAGNYYYEVVASGDPEPTIDTSGVGTACTTSETTIDLSGLTAGAKSIYIKVKDSADNVSNVLKIDIPAYVAPDTTAPVLTAGTVNRTSDTAGSVKFTSDEAGNYYYEVVASGDPEPTIDTSGVGTACTTSETTIDLSGLTAGAKSIYIKVKDSADNVSNVLKIDIPAYVAPDTTAPVLTAGAVNRTSDTAGSVKFTSDEAGNYYYEVVASGDPEPTIDTSGVGTACTTSETTIDLSGLTAGAKSIYIKVKDSADNVSNVLKIDIPAYVAPDTTAPVLTAGAVNRTSDTAGSVKFTSDEAGNYYYEVVASGDPEPTIDTSGVGTACTTSETTIDLSGLTAGAKSIYIKVKDSADNVSNVLKIDIPAYVAPDTTAPVLTAGTVNRTSDTAGSVKFTSDEAGNYYYEVVASGDPEPTIDTSGVGTACTTSETTIDLSGLTAGAKSIYIKVKDSADNVSNVLKIDIPAYVAPDTTAPVLTAGTVNRTSDAAVTVKFTSNESGRYYYKVVASGDPEPTIDTSGS